MKLKYIGAHDGVEIDMPDGTVQTVQCGQTGEFPQELAAALLEQRENWEAADERKPSKKDTAEAGGEEVK